MIIARSYDQSGELVGYKADTVSGIMEFQDDEISEIPVIVKNDRTAYAKKLQKEMAGLLFYLTKTACFRILRKKDN